jgi:Protein of unknown function (DUF2917)
MPFDFVAKRSQRQFLPGRTTLQLDNAEGTVIAVEGGCLWITMENDPRDIVLTRGMRFEVDRSGRTLVTAEEDTRFGLLAPGTCACSSEESMAALITRRLDALFGQWARRKPFVPYF